MTGMKTKTSRGVAYGLLALVKKTWRLTKALFYERSYRILLSMRPSKSLTIFALYHTFTIIWMAFVFSHLWNRFYIFENYTLFIYFLWFLSRQSISRIKVAILVNMVTVSDLHSASLWSKMLTRERNQRMKTLHLFKLVMLVFSEQY